MKDISHDELIAEGLIAPVETGGADERYWLDCDLASLAENRLDDRTDPLNLDEGRRASWMAKATREPRTSLAKEGDYERFYWLLEGGERVGTIALSTTTFGARDLRVASFYVFPSHRGRGTGRRALAGLGSILARQRSGYRLDTCWSWQRTVRFYLRAGLWIYMWKRELTFCWNAGLPAHIIEVGAEEATLSVARGDERVVLARAHRRGDQLVLDEPRKELAREPGIGEAYWHAPSTLSLALALEGWPLVRSREQWDKSHYADGGPPEALAYKITIWEALDRDHGWRVEAPRIPGLAYPTWAEFEARWEADAAEFDAKVVRRKVDE